MFGAELAVFDHALDHQCSAGFARQHRLERLGTGEGIVAEGGLVVDVVVRPLAVGVLPCLESVFGGLGTGPGVEFFEGRRGGEEVPSVLLQHLDVVVEALPEHAEVVTNLGGGEVDGGLDELDVLANRHLDRLRVERIDVVEERFGLCLGAAIGHCRIIGVCCLTRTVLVSVIGLGRRGSSVVGCLGCGVPRRCIPLGRGVVGAAARHGEQSDHGEQERDDKTAMELHVGETRGRCWGSRAQRFTLLTADTMARSEADTIDSWRPTPQVVSRAPVSTST